MHDVCVPSTATHGKGGAEVSNGDAGGIAVAVLVGRGGRLGPARCRHTGGRQVLAHGQDVGVRAGDVSSSQSGYLGEVVRLALARVTGRREGEDAALRCRLIPYNSY